MTCGHDCDVQVFARVDTNALFGLLMVKEYREYTRVDDMEFVEEDCCSEFSVASNKISTSLLPERPCCHSN